MPVFHRISSRLLPVVLAISVVIGTGPDALRLLTDVSLLIAQVSLELCQMGLAVIRICGI